MLVEENQREAMLVDIQTISGHVHNYHSTLASNVPKVKKGGGSGQDDGGNAIKKCGYCGRLKPPPG